MIGNVRNRGRRQRDRRRREDRRHKSPSDLGTEIEDHDRKDNAAEDRGKCVDNFSAEHDRKSAGGKHVAQMINKGIVSCLRFDVAQSLGRFLQRDTSAAKVTGHAVDLNDASEISGGIRHAMGNGQRLTRGIRQGHDHTRRKHECVRMLKMRRCENTVQCILHAVRLRTGRDHDRARKHSHIQKLLIIIVGFQMINSVSNNPNADFSNLPLSFIPQNKPFVNMPKNSSL